jgi:hypothetical protein
MLSALAMMALMEEPMRNLLAMLSLGASLALSGSASARAANPPAMPSGPGTPAFDIASLPRIETITEATDVRVFLAPGVPWEVTRAVLRYVWVIDPDIRDFLGLQENDWDFNDPDATPSFGYLASSEYVEQRVAEVFGAPHGQTDRLHYRDAEEATSWPWSILRKMMQTVSMNSR